MDPYSQEREKAKVQQNPFKNLDISMVVRSSLKKVII